MNRHWSRYCKYSYAFVTAYSSRSSMNSIIFVLVIILSGCIHVKTDEFKNHPCSQIKDPAIETRTECLTTNEKDYKNFMEKNNYETKGSLNSCGWAGVKLSDGIYLGMENACKKIRSIKIRVYCQDDSLNIKNLIRNKKIVWKIKDNSNQVVQSGESDSGIEGVIYVPIPATGGIQIEILNNGVIHTTFSPENPLDNIAFRGNECRR